MNETSPLDEILDISPFACVLMADDYVIQYMNPMMTRFLSMRADEDLRGTPLLNFLSAEDQVSFTDFLAGLVDPIKEQTWQVFQFVDGNGEEKNILMNGGHNLADEAASQVFFLVGIPLFGDELRAILPDYLEQRLIARASYNKYESIFDNIRVGITILDADSTIEETNQTFADFFEMNKRDLAGKPLGAILDDRSMKTIDGFFQRARPQGESRIKKVLILNPDEDDQRILEVSLETIQNATHDQSKCLLITEDVTEQKETHAALLQTEKLSLTGRLAASLAHEINNPLQTSIGCLGLAKEMLEGDTKGLGVYIDMAIEELQRSARIVKKLRDLNRKSDLADTAIVNLQELIEGVLILTKKRTVDRNIIPVFPYHGPPPLVMASHDQLQQVLLNLMMNAIDALDGGGNIYLDIVPTANPDGFEIKVRDTGPGISPEGMKHLFSPFYTTKEEGLGLGLYICRSIVDDHRGALNVVSEPGNGAEVTVWLPGPDSEDQKE